MGIRGIGRLESFVGVKVRLAEINFVVLAGGSDQPVWFDQVQEGEIGLGMRRFGVYASLAEVTALELGQHGDPAQIAVFGYDFKIKSRTQVAQVEFGAMLRHRLVAEGWAIAELPPSLVWGFLGCGPNEGRAQSQRAVEDSWGQRFATPDLAEAYGLAQAARCLREPGAYPTWRVEALRRVVRGRGSQIADRAACHAVRTDRIEVNP